MPLWSLVATWCFGGARKYLADIGIDTFGLAPVFWVSEGYFFKANSITPVGSVHVKVSGDYGTRSETGMPILSQLGPTPWAEPGNSVESYQVVPQGIMVDEDHGFIFWNFFEPSREHQLGEVNLLGQWYLGLSGSYTWQLFSVGGCAIFNLEDNSALLTLSLGYEVLENMTLGLGGMVPLGSTPRLEGNVFDEGTQIRFDSEFGLYPLLGYFDLRAAF